MEIKVLESSKDEIKIEMDSLTVVEILRVYLNKDSSVVLAVWKREHPTKNPVLHIEADNPKKLLKSAIATLEKEIDTAVADFKKLK